MLKINYEIIHCERKKQVETIKPFNSPAKRICSRAQIIINVRESYEFEKIMKLQSEKLVGPTADKLLRYIQYITNYILMIKYYYY